MKKIILILALSMSFYALADGTGEEGGADVVKVACDTKLNENEGKKEDAAAPVAADQPSGVTTDK